MGGKNQFYSCPLHTAVESLILDKKNIRTFWCNLNLITFFLSTFPLHPWCHPGRELWAEYIILELLTKNTKDNMVSRFWNPVFLTAFLRPMLIAKIWEGYPEHAESSPCCFSPLPLHCTSVQHHTGKRVSGRTWVIQAGSVTLESYCAGSLHIVKWINHHFFSSPGLLKFFLICFTCHYKVSFIMLLQAFNKHENT